MKYTPLGLALGSMLLWAQSLPATLYFEEGFNYTAGVGLGLNGPWSSGNNNIKVGSASLSYAGLADVATPGNDCTVTSGVSAGSIVASFNSTALTGGSVYYSFLAQCLALPTANNYLTSLLPTGATGPNGSGDPLSVYVGQATAGSTYRVGVRHSGIGSGATYANNAAFTLGTVNLFVVKYTFNPGTGDDSVSLFVNPLLGGAEPTADVLVTGTGSDAANLQVLGFKAQSAGTVGNWAFDTLRVGDSWESVLVTVPEPSSLALLGLGLLSLGLRRRAR